MRLFILLPECDSEENSLWDWVESTEPWSAEREAQWNSPHPLRDSWHPLNLRIVSATRSGDFYAFNKHPIVTPRAWEVIQPVVRDSVEALPVNIVNGGPLLLLNVLDGVPLAVGAVTLWRGMPRLATLIHRFVFHESDLLDKVIFRITGEGMRFDHCVVAETFKDAVLAGGLKGADFSEITWHRISLPEYW